MDQSLHILLDTSDEIGLIQMLSTAESQQDVFSPVAVTTHDSKFSSESVSSLVPTLQESVLHLLNLAPLASTSTRISDSIHLASSDLDNDLSFDCAAVGHPTSSDRQPWIPDPITWKVMTLYNECMQRPQPHVAIPDSIKTAACTSDKHDKENQSVDDESWSQSMSIGLDIGLKKVGPSEETYMIFFW